MPPRLPAASAFTTLRWQEQKAQPSSWGVTTRHGGAEGVAAGPQILHLRQTEGGKEGKTVGRKESNVQVRKRRID